MDSSNSGVVIPARTISTVGPDNNVVYENRNEPNFGGGGSQMIVKNRMGASAFNKNTKITIVDTESKVSSDLETDSYMGESVIFRKVPLVT